MAEYLVQSESLIAIAEAVRAKTGKTGSMSLEGIASSIENIELRTQINVIPDTADSFTYDGNVKTPNWRNFETEQLMISGTTEAIDAGIYTVYFTPQTGYEWWDNTTTPKEAYWSISKKSITIVPSQDGTLVYNGSNQTPSWINYNSAQLVLSGTISGTNVGTYNATFTPKSNYQWDDGSTSAKTVSWKIERQPINIPEQGGSLTYTGDSLEPTWSNYDSNQITIGGTTSGVNAGSYNATFTPKSNYKWSDGTTTTKTVAWTISKAAGSLTLSASSGTINGNGVTKTFTVTRSGNGKITVSSSNTTIATVSLSGTTVTITSKKKGSATITVSVAAGTNHTAPSNKTYAVTVDYLYLYNAGNQNTAVTGGWSAIQDYVWGSTTVNSSNLYMQCGNSASGDWWCEAAFQTSNLIDLTNYTTLYANGHCYTGGSFSDGSSAGLKIAVFDSSGNNVASGGVNKSGTACNPTINVSSLNGKYRIRMYAYTYGGTEYMQADGYFTKVYLA